METDIKKIIGHRLQRIRQEKALTQEEMGEKLNLSTSAYCKIEYGETDLTLTRLNRIAEVLNMSAIELFSKIDGDTHFNHCQNFIGYAQHNNTVNLNNDENLRELVKANSLLIESLSKRIDQLEKAVK